MAEMTKDKRIKKEIKILRNEYADIDPKHKMNADRIITRAAYLKATLEDLEKDLDANGWTELFQQSDKCDPYERKRPNADLYISLSAQYLRSVKSLDAMLPKGDNATKNDDLMEFLNDRS